MADVKIKCDKLDACQCGYKPDHYTIMYGRTPYSVWCPECTKQTNRYKSIGGMPDNIVKFWNKIAPLIEISKWNDNQGLIYEYDGKQYVHEQMRQVILSSGDNRQYDLPVYILFQNGKIETDKKQWLRKDD